MPATARRSYDQAMSRARNLDPETARAALESKRRTLIELSRAAAENGSSIELDQTKVGRLSRMDAIQSKEMEAATAQRRNAEIKAIAAAIDRLEQGDYGYCVTCGEPISLKRLENDPAVALCIGCAR